MLPFAYPVIVVFLLPVIAIEAVYIRMRLRTDWGTTIRATAKANLITLLLGFPLAWLGCRRSSGRRAGGWCR
jgi:branched-subunit amino acid ABC-type transport system permease component